MTKQEAIEAMLTGAKVTHPYFASGEWITMKGPSLILTEEGYIITIHDFWYCRSENPQWEDNWSIF